MKMRKDNLTGALACLCLIMMGASAAHAQRRTTPVAAANSAATTSDPLAALPAADGVMFVDMNRVLNEAMPRLLAGNPARLAQANADLDNFKQRTGIDPRSIERLAVGTRYTNPSPNVTKLDTVAVARGRFSAGTIIAAGRLAAKGKYAEQQHAGRTLYVFTLDEQIKMFGLLKMSVGELAITALDANTLAFGKPDIVRATVDAARGRRSSAPNAALMQLANRTPGALVGFGGNIPAGLLANVDLGNPEINRSLAAVRQASGSLGMTDTNYELLMTARTTDARAAANLNETIDAARGLAGLLATGLSGDRGRLARHALDSLRVSVENTDVNIRVALANADVETLLRGLK